MSSKPKVQPDDLDLAFYQATAAAGTLCLQHCRDCGAWTHPARYYCPNCSSENYAFDPVCGRAEILLGIQRAQHRIGRDTGIEGVDELAEGGLAAHRFVQADWLISSIISSAHPSIVPIASGG